jgi:allophanate hydrolase subunit 2
MPKRGHLRLLPGPEWNRVAHSDHLSGPWRIDARSSGMGLRLTGPTLTDSVENNYDVLSCGVSDGTVQMTAAGLIILLRERAALGGYARIATVIPCDLDCAAQMRPNQAIHLDLIDSKEAKEILALRQLF